MNFTNSKGYEYQIRLVGVDETDLITLENIRINHPDRPDMTLEEYFTFAGAEAERPYFEYMKLEILDSLQEGNGLTITQEDLDLLPEESAKDLLDHYAYTKQEFVNIRIYREDRDRLAARMKYGETMAEKIHMLIKEAKDFKH